MANGSSAAERASTYLAVENAKALVKSQGGNPSLIGSHDVALAHLDATLGSGSEQSAARAKLDKVGHKHG
jgi:hypothetical protein